MMKQMRKSPTLVSKRGKFEKASWENKKGVFCRAQLEFSFQRTLN